MIARVKTYFGEWGLFTWLFVFTSLFQIRFCFTTNEVLGFKSHKQNTRQKSHFKVSTYSPGCLLRQKKTTAPMMIRTAGMAITIPTIAPKLPN